MATQSEIKYDRLMEKAEELFCQLGYKAVSMDEIAAAAGISKMTIYKYFSSKEDLFFKVVESVSDRAYIKLENLITNVDGTIEKIDAMLNFSLDITNLFSVVFYKDVMENKYIAEKLVETKKIKSRKIFTEIITNGIEKGEIRNIDVEFIAELLNIIIDGLLRNHSGIIASEESIKYFSERFYDFLKYGLLGN
ncbi:TetR/AcrR family transcriptional regulator [Tissierella sp. Yu-01]|uniref:TetR/AcrR family transcriptional regulator n=1 Tax=Tissierella sp. Yu-01 TaxID=3035694 RepID=UPI00240E6537|nr:TetR/AcrR family transcriptional regulator [Tissierella sp. Yu-01]WFA08564.1 TetR/AcrR family transcriptional regulator [Tissierella sp. Yu-01]